VLSTIRSAKGPEWDLLHLIHASDGNLPSDMALSSPQGHDEERRLLYVAVTRPRRALNVYVPVRYFHRPGGVDEASGLGKTSRFLTDKVQSLCEVVHTTATHWPPLLRPASQLLPLPATAYVLLHRLRVRSADFNEQSRSAAPEAERGEVDARVLGLVDDAAEPARNKLGDRVVRVGDVDRVAFESPGERGCGGLAVG
jgi:UvrD-like helicase family protein